jgi:hypothetical protein
MTHETRRCSVEGCPSLAALEVMRYHLDPGEGAVRFERDPDCPYLCLEHVRDNERRAEGERALHGYVTYPHTNRDRRPGLSLYLDLRTTDVD